MLPDARSGVQRLIGLLMSCPAAQIITSRDVKVAGLLGPASPLEKKSVSVAETPVGLGGTTLWKMASLDACTTLAAFFEIVAAGRGGNADGAQAAEQFVLQFITKYLHESGESRCRVTTVTRRCDGSPATQYYIELCTLFVWFSWTEAFTECFWLGSTSGI